MGRQIVERPDEHKKQSKTKSLLKTSLYVIPVYVIAKAFKGYLEKNR